MSALDDPVIMEADSHLRAALKCLEGLSAGAGEGMTLLANILSRAAIVHAQVHGASPIEQTEPAFKLAFHAYEIEREKGFPSGEIQ